MQRGKYKRKEGNYKIKDDVELNSWWGFDYCFCHSDCGNIHCGRNTKSDSFKRMMCQPDDAIYTASDFTKVCRAWRKPKGE